MSSLVVEGRKISPLRGRVVIREEKPASSSLLWTPPKDLRDETHHQGTVLAVGPPARTTKGVEVPPEFKIGSRVLFVWSAQEKQWSHQLGLEMVAWVPQENVIAELPK